MVSTILERDLKGHVCFGAGCDCDCSSYCHCFCSCSCCLVVLASVCSPLVYTHTHKAETVLDVRIIYILSCCVSRC